MDTIKAMIINVNHELGVLSVAPTEEAYLWAAEKIAERLVEKGVCISANKFERLNDMTQRVINTESRKVGKWIFSDHTEYNYECKCPHCETLIVGLSKRVIPSSCPNCCAQLEL